jgi:hypothetical protein
VFVGLPGGSAVGAVDPLPLKLSLPALEVLCGMANTDGEDGLAGPEGLAVAGVKGMVGDRSTSAWKKIGVRGVLRHSSIYIRVMVSLLRFLKLDCDRVTNSTFFS